MKLIIAILPDTDADNATQALTAAEFRVTRIASTGGFLRRGVVTLLIGLKDERVDEAIQVMRSNTTQTGGEDAGGMLFVLPVENFIQV